MKMKKIVSMAACLAMVGGLCSCSENKVNKTDTLTWYVPSNELTDKAAVMEEINKITGRDYKPFNYYGDPKATKVIVAMGSVCGTIKDTVTPNLKLSLI